MPAGWASRRAQAQHLRTDRCWARDTIGETFGGAGCGWKRLWRKAGAGREVIAAMWRCWRVKTLASLQDCTVLQGDTPQVEKSIRSEPESGESGASQEWVRVKSERQDIIPVPYAGGKSGRNSRGKGASAANSPVQRLAQLAPNYGRDALRRARPICCGLPRR